MPAGVQKHTASCHHPYYRLIDLEGAILYIVSAAVNTVTFLASEREREVILDNLSSVIDELSSQLKLSLLYSKRRAILEGYFNEH